MKLSEYRKTLSALVTGLLGWAGVVVVSDAAAISSAEWLALGVAVATALGVLAISNEPQPHEP